MSIISDAPDSVLLQGSDRGSQCGGGFYGYRINLVPRVLSLAALVAAGHVEMSVNKLRSGDRSPTKFCRLDDEILSGVGRKFLLQNGA